MIGARATPKPPGSLEALQNGNLLVREFKEDIMLKHIHQSQEDMWLTESCLLLRDFTCTKDVDYEI